MQFYQSVKFLYLFLLNKLKKQQNCSQKGSFVQKFAVFSYFLLNFIKYKGLKGQENKVHFLEALPHFLLKNPPLPKVHKSF